MRKEVVEMLKEKGLSQRKSCELASISRSAYKYQKKPENEVLVGRIKELAYQHIRYGYRRIWALLSREGWQINVKRVWRIWKMNNLQVPRKKPKQRRQGISCQNVPNKTLAPMHVWTLDFVHDTLSHGRRIRMLTVVDEFTRECLAIHPDYSLKAKDVRSVLAKLFIERGSPCYLRSDNGSEFIEKSLRKWLKEQGVDSIFIDPGSPWQNGKCESFNGKLRDECLNAQWFRTLKEAKLLVELWRREYNSFRPHRALRYKTPNEFADYWNAMHSSNELRTVV